MKRKIQIHRIATDDMTHILERKDKSLIYWKHSYIPRGIEENGWSFHHLYGTVSKDVEPCLKGDWLIRNNKLFQKNHDLECNSRKIVVTTNELIIGTTEITHPTQDNSSNIYLSKFENSFVIEYCNSGGIDEALIECGDFCSNCGEEHCDKLQCRGYKDTFQYEYNIDNTIAIYPLEEKIYTTEEVKELCTSAYLTGHDDGQGTMAGPIMIDSFSAETWIKENL